MIIGRFKKMWGQQNDLPLEIVSLQEALDDFLAASLGADDRVLGREERNGWPARMRQAK